ncbi:BlaI/MecI/CopY family transcriptional regulator [Pontibacter sp. 172403-2]|uniref:BlaI/MecI/CopY family transcriptional regulator n=1 Tax=Pontibacter rufus TaxID=2791028 RepID=UPI0018AFBB21|nr:BlaI/MecI/CopY family transcriptional regulator [Pontibacter sp. 172403-2]MBF9255782.1 BlaI/MecI/CopY family transcriptional regulator [Pontibacter sp. 172403-2]
MQKLGKREEQIMQVVWQLEKAFIKEIMDELPEPKPHYNTIATMVKILTEKGFLSAEKIGNTYQYTPLVPLAEYRQQDVATIKKKYFGNSFTKMITHFAKEEKLSDEEIDELVRIIKSQKNR